MIREEIQAVYAAGLEAVIALVQSLWARIAAQQEQIHAQQAQITALTAVSSQNFGVFSHLTAAARRATPGQ